ncbi:hypothetical protein HZB94_04855 [Candidatus Falkowbacteria bacterium]|nr:hypothetical protein [Candidatus Falkowbacteria bacterium]
MKQPYLKKIGEISKWTVWAVDGQHIRTKINEEFTNFGQHFRFPFIPKWEFWIDQEGAEGETQFFIDHLLVEWRLMNKGCSYDHAVDKADAMEKQERAKSALMRRVKKHLKKAIIPKELYRRKIMENRGLKVWIVSGELTRDLFFIDFTEGGHHFVYHFVPRAEVWIDDDVQAAERKFVILHELHERYLMSQGLSYLRAHRSASHIEYECRHRPSLLRAKLKEEMKRNVNLA